MNLASLHQHLDFLNGFQGISTDTENIPENSLVVQVGETPLRLDFAELPSEEEQGTLEALTATWVDRPEPRWSNFLDDLASVGCYPAISQAGGTPVLVGRILRLANGGAAFQGAADPLIIMWNASPPELTSQQRASLQSAADANFVPLTVAEDNTVSFDG